MLLSMMLKTQLFFPLWLLIISLAGLGLGAWIFFQRRNAEKVLLSKNIPSKSNGPIEDRSQEDLEWLNKIKEIALREMSNGNFSINDLAQEMLLSRSQIFRRIKKLTGQTPKKYLNSIIH